MKTMNKSLAVLAVLVAGGAQAINPATFDVTVNINAVLSVAVAGGPLAYGAQAPNTDVVSGTAAVVTNDSTGLVEDYQLSVANSTDWTIGAAKGADTATMHALFNAAAPTPATFVATDQLTGGAAPVLAGVSAAGNFAGDQDGQDVNPSEANNLWILLGLPTTDSSAGASQTFVVTVTAVAP